MQTFGTILFAADFSQNSKEAFREACSLAIDNETRLVVLFVVEPNWVPEDPPCYGQQAVQFYAAEPDEAPSRGSEAKAGRRVRPGPSHQGGISDNGRRRLGRDPAWLRSWVAV